MSNGPQLVRLEKTVADATPKTQALWVAIRNRAKAISFTNYHAYIERVLCEGESWKEEEIGKFEYLKTDFDLSTVLESQGVSLTEGTQSPQNVKWGQVGQTQSFGASACCPPATYRIEVELTAEPDDDGKRTWEVVIYRKLKQERGSKSGRMTGQPVDPCRRFRGSSAYELLKTATEAFLLLNCGVRIDKEGFDPDEGFDDFDEDEEGSRLRNWSTVNLETIRAQLAELLGTTALPYLDLIVNALGASKIDNPFCGDGVVAANVDCPCLLELIWSYFMEEGMLVQSLNAISLRFQNKRAPGRATDPLANMNTDPLRPLSNFLWGYIQDERHRLTVSRRAHEYDCEYGISLLGKVVPLLRTVDSRSKFLEAFHALVRLTTIYYRDAADATKVPDAFPLLNALKEVHLEQAAGAHNQFGDLPWQARVEMLMQQWILARPETSDFLTTRTMVPYAEAWMGKVDAMKTLQGWTDTSVRYFRDLAVYGEEILLSIRYGNWSDETDEEAAKNWADYFKPEVQAYVHAYRAATGVDLTADVSDPRNAKMMNTPPAVHLKRRLEEQRRSG